VYRIAVKPGFPARLDGIAVATVQGGSPLHIGDAILTAGGQQIRSGDEMEFLCNQYAIGDPVSIQLSRDGDLRSVTVELIADNTLSKIVIESFAALLFFFAGITVLLLQQKEKAARIFHHLTIAIAALILLTPGIYHISLPALSYLHGFLFYLFYTFVPVLFFHFTTVFPQEKIHKPGKILLPLYGIGFALSLWTSYTFLRAAYPTVDLIHYSAYGTAFTFILLFFALLFLAGFGNIIHSYVRAKEEFERRKLRWILFGIIFGACGYIGLSVIPRIFVRSLILPEEYLIAFTIIAPLSFAISIVRYRVFDIDLIFSRSTVYTLVIILLLALYLGIVWLFTQVVYAVQLPSVLPNIIGALFIALLFEPLRKRMQKLVDKKFFRVSYDFYEAQRGFLEEIKFAQTESLLAESVTNRTDAILSVERIAFFTIEPSSGRMRLASHKGFDILERRGIRLEKEELKTALDLPVALDGKVEPGVEYETADAAVFARWGIALVLPMLSEDHEILGFFVLGEKRSGSRFTIEDISLLNSVSVQAGQALGRIGAERNLLLEQAESERLSELNQLKSYFVSSVSHDLKTPLTSIRMFAEIMKERDDIPKQRVQEYLGIIEGEADRLSRLITNVLDFAKIEKGTKEYSFKPVDLNILLRDVIRSLEYQIHSQGFKENLILASGPLIVSADKDAVFDAVTNLITNAMKYSPPQRKRLSLTSAKHNGYAAIAVEDEGYGIAENEKEHIFESFYRVHDPKIKSTGGAGLGLSLVKHTMDAHHGKVELRSEVGKGSIFVLYFPIDPHEKNPDH